MAETFKIMIVEDRPIWQHILHTEVQKATSSEEDSVDIRLLENFEDAVSLLQDESWHLLITDIGLKPRSEEKLGIQLVRRAKTTGIPCIAVSGTPVVTIKDVENILFEHGALDFFWKLGFNNERFSKRVEFLYNTSRETDSAHNNRAMDLIPEVSERTLLREWWYNIQREQGRSFAYAFLLSLPGDKVILDYLENCAAEFNIMSKFGLRIIALGGNRIQGTTNEESISSIIREDILLGTVSEVMNFFQIPIQDAPCLLVFKDIRSPDHVVVPLKSDSQEAVKDIIRQIANAVQVASWYKNDPLAAITESQVIKVANEGVKSVFHGIRRLASKSFETAIDLAIKNLMK